jgi:hypothetical protein
MEIMLGSAQSLYAGPSLRRGLRAVALPVFVTGWTCWAGCGTQAQPRTPPPAPVIASPVVIAPPAPSPDDFRLATGTLLGTLSDDGDVSDAVGNELGQVSPDGATLRSADGSMLAQLADTGVVAASAVAEEPLPLAPGDQVLPDGSIVSAASGPLVSFSGSSFQATGVAQATGTTSVPPSRARGLALYLLLLADAENGTPVAIQP